MDTVKNVQTGASLLTSCSRLACYQQANIKIGSPGLGQLLDDEYVASCMPLNLLQVNCRTKFVIHGLHFKLFKQVLTSVQKASCNKPDFNKLVAT